MLRLQDAHYAIQAKTTHHFPSLEELLEHFRQSPFQHESVGNVTLGEVHDFLLLGVVTTQSYGRNLRRLQHTRTPFNGPLSGTTRVSRYQKGKTNLDFTGARDTEWQWHQLGHMQVCTSLQTNNHASTPPLSFLQAGCPSCRPTSSIKALKARALKALQHLWNNNFCLVSLQVTVPECGRELNLQ